MGRAWGYGRMRVSRLPTTLATITNNNRHQINCFPSLMLPSSSNTRNQRLRWHIRDVLLATVPVVASLGACDASLGIS